MGRNTIQHKSINFIGQSLISRSPDLEVAGNFPRPIMLPKGLGNVTIWRNRRLLSSIRSEFTVGVHNGFLPRRDPVVELPKQFQALESLLQEMPVVKTNGKSGLLGKGQLGDASCEVPLYDIQSLGPFSTRTLTALFRDYTFWASAYLLEPCHQNLLSKGTYGAGRPSLPANIARPLWTIAKLLGMKPFMEYATSYALYNWRRLNVRRPPCFDNLALIRAFTGHPSEAGFILVHVAMVANSKYQVRAVGEILSALALGQQSQFNAGLRHHRDALRRINDEMESMWLHSSPDDYKTFRTFIMGIKNQSMFPPEGVFYEGVEDEEEMLDSRKEPTLITGNFHGVKGRYGNFRGESGANDSIIPTADNLLQLTQRMPHNPLTTILRDFRSYRPPTHSEWLARLESRVQRLNLREFALADVHSTILYLENLDLIREFRQRHWNFTKEYILKHTSHPVATGGSPIATWLPNQLRTVLRFMKETGEILTKQIKHGRATLTNRKLEERLAKIKMHIASQEAILNREEARYSQLVRSKAFRK